MPYDLYWGKTQASLVGDTTWPEFPVNNGEELQLRYGMFVEIRFVLVLLQIFVHFAWREDVRNLIIS
jgi:hypothetical protein